MKLKAWITYRTGYHRAVVYEHLHSQVDFNLFNSFAPLFVDTPKSKDNSLQSSFANQEYKSCDSHDVLVFDWENAQLTE